MMRLTNVMVVGAVCALGLTGCADDDGTSDKLSWEQFRADAEKKIEVGGEQKTIYVVDGDIPVSLEELRRQYRLYLEHVPGVSPRSTVNLTGGQRDIWHGQQEQNLTYCVSNAFGANKDRAVREMHEAGVAWELAADVRFTYVPAHDGNCHNGNTAILFSVQPWNQGGACAFFPSGDACVPRTVVVDYPSIDAGFAGAPNVRSVGVLRHELGHVLGLRHEQNQPAGNSCREDLNWAAVTDYDQRSVMHYPWCAGNSGSDLSLTTFDKQGARKLYGAPSVIRDARRDKVDVNGDAREDIALSGPQFWGSLPVSFSTGGGGWSVTNFAIVNFAVWAATPGVEVLRGDFNGDYRTDFALTGPFFWGSIPVAMSNGNGTFNVTNAAVGDFAVWSAADNARALVGDFNGDNRADIALTGAAGWGSIPVAFSQGNGTFVITNHSVANFPVWTTVANAHVVVGDYNHDGRADLAITGPSWWGSIPVAFSNGNGTFYVTNAPVGDFAVWAAGEGVEVLAGDFDGDGRTDIALTGQPGWGTMPIARANGDGSWTITNPWVGDFAVWSASDRVEPVLGDFNGDGRTDVALTGQPGWGSVPVAFAVPGGWSVTNHSIANFAVWSATGARPLPGDFNGDGRADIALTGTPGWGSVPVAHSNGNGTFSVTNGAVGAFADWASTNGVWVK